MNLRRTWSVISLGILLSVGLSACGGDDDASAGDPQSGAQGSAGASATAAHADVSDSGVAPASDSSIEIAGQWTSDYGDESIDDKQWTGAAIVKFDNTKNFAITQNADDAQYDPGKFNKLVWTEPKAEGFFYCTVDFGLDSASAAENTSKTADDSDPANMGCGGFAWTELKPR